jgi:hypothetical protein
MNNPKDKFITRNNIENYEYINKYDSNNVLLKPIFNSKHNNKVELSNLDTIHGNYEIKNKIINDTLHGSQNEINNSGDLPKSIMFDYQNISAGRGFSNLKLSDDMYGKSSRNDNDMFKRKQEGTTISRFTYLHRNVQDSRNIVLDDLPRGGECTRKQDPIKIDTMRHLNVNTSTNNIIFDY